MFRHDIHHHDARLVVGRLIRSTRRARGLTQAQLGERAGVHQTVISRLELGRPMGLRLGTFMRLLDALGIAQLQAGLASWYLWSEEPGADRRPEHVFLRDAYRTRSTDRPHSAWQSRPPIPHADPELNAEPELSPRRSA